MQLFLVFKPNLCPLESTIGKGEQGEKMKPDLELNSQHSLFVFLINIQITRKSVIGRMGLGVSSLITHETIVPSEIGYCHRCFAYLTPSSFAQCHSSASIISC